MLLDGGLDSRVQADEEHEEVGGYGVWEVGEVGVDAGRGVGGGGPGAGTL